MASTTIKVSTETRDRIKALGGDTYEETILAALDAYEAAAFWAEAERAAAWRRSLPAVERKALEERDAEVVRAFDGLG